MTFGDVLEKNPNSASVFFKYGMHCIGCAMASSETIEQGCKAHGMNAKETKKLVDELNKFILSEDIINK